MPTTPWDTVFGGIASWLGISENDLDKVCPNLYNFDSSYLLDPEDMFDAIEVPPPVPSQAPQPYSSMPSDTIEYLPSDTPSLSPSKEKSFNPSQAPSELPSQMPSVMPSMHPSEPPSLAPSELPSQMPSVVPSMQSSDYCKDSTLRLKIPWNGGRVTRSCAWVANKQTTIRCNVEGVAQACRKTCGTCSICADSTLRLRIPWNGKNIARYCTWVANKQTIMRCNVDGVADACSQTCGVCS